MSPYIRRTGGDGVDDSGSGADSATELLSIGTTTPTIEPPDYLGVGVIQPEATTKLEAELHTNTTTDTNLCGESQTTKTGDKNYRITMEGVILKSTLEKMKQVPWSNDPVELVSDIHTGGVVFDVFTFTQESDGDHGRFTFDGVEVDQPIFSFQLQTKEESNSRRQKTGSAGIASSSWPE